MILLKTALILLLLALSFAMAGLLAVVFEDRRKCTVSFNCLIAMIVCGSMGIILEICAEAYLIL